MAERMPSDSLLDADPVCGWYHVLPQYRLAQQGLSPAVLARSEDPILGLAVGAGLPPERKRVSHDGMDWHRLL